MDSRDQAWSKYAKGFRNAKTIEEARRYMNLMNKISEVYGERKE